MNWLGLLIVALVGALVAGCATALLSGRKPGWTAARRTVTAASIAPALILAGSLIGAALVRFEGANDMRGIVVGALIAIGLQGALAALVPGLIASVLAERALRNS